MENGKQPETSSAVSSTGESTIKACVIVLLQQQQQQQQLS